MRGDFGAAANSVEAAVANSSRVLPLVTTAHLPSASNHSFWPEMYTNMPIVLGSERSPYSDTPDPKCFGTVSPLDPQLFSTIVEHAADLLASRANPKYSPVEVAEWLEDFTTASAAALQNARAQGKRDTSPEFRRMEEDVLIQNGLGQFFAAKLRSGVLYAIYQHSGAPDAANQALDQYRKARDVWAVMARRAQKIYRDNITYGNVPIRQGQWMDRLPSIEKDIASMQAALNGKAGATKTNSKQVQEAIQAVMQRRRRPSVACSHSVPQAFQPGKPLSVALSLARKGADVVAPSVLLQYRHVNQAERWHSVEMDQAHSSFESAIPGEYTNSAYPLQYYFEFRRGSSEAWLYPAFNATLSNQPYFAIHKRQS